jgi:hypothetical protein
VEVLGQASAAWATAVRCVPIKEDAKKAAYQVLQLRIT